MKRVILPAVVAALLAGGCGGPKVSDPKAVNVKQDPRIQRAGSGTNVERTIQPSAPLKKPTRKDAK